MMSYKSKGRPQSYAKQVAMERLWLNPEPECKGSGCEVRRTAIKIPTIQESRKQNGNVIRIPRKTKEILKF
jgi:hypothetical protein